MQYFSFLGLGNQGVYDTLTTRFQQDSSLELQTPFVQDLIAEKHKDELTGIWLFLTPKAREHTLKVFEEHWQGVPIHKIDITDNCTFEEFVPKLRNAIQEDEIVIDVTHSFRSIPYRLLLALTYVEQVNNTTLRGLYYGQMLTEGDSRTVVVEDLLKDYRMQKISGYLSEFNEFLMISPKPWREAAKDDKTMRKFLKSMEEFNKSIELCSLNQAIRNAKEIVKFAKAIEQKANEYETMIPLITKIIEKLEGCTIQSNAQNQVALIRLLISHSRYQVAATFTDGCFREEVIRYLLYPGMFNQDAKTYAGKCPVRIYSKEQFSYQFSQNFLQYEMNLKNKKNPKPAAGMDQIVDKLIDRQLLNEDRIHDLDQMLYDSREIINGFFDRIRNPLNHGAAVEMEYGQVKESVEKMLGLIERMQEREKGQE